jgi:hypothetical protein
VQKGPGIEFDEAFVGWGNEDWDLFYGLNVIEGFDVVLVDAIAYEVTGEINKREAWSQRQFIEHLVTGFQFLDKWGSTGPPIEAAIPRYDFDPVTERWSLARRRPIRNARFDYEAYVRSAREWLVRNGFYAPRTGTVGLGNKRDQP